MRIGIIGSGNMGRAIGIRFAQLGHDVRFGARNPEQSEAAAERAGHDASFGDVDAAARHGEVLVWTVREPDPAAILSDPGLLHAKIVIDINNRDYASDVQGGRWFERAIAETLQANAPQARVVKALNVVAMETFDTDPQALRAASAQVFMAGGDPKAKAVVAALLNELGFAAQDVGSGPVAMRAVEALGDIVRLLMIDGQKGAGVNFQLRNLPEPKLGSIGIRGDSNYH